MRNPVEFPFMWRTVFFADGTWCQVYTVRTLREIVRRHRRADDHAMPWTEANLRDTISSVHRGALTEEPSS